MPAMVPTMPTNAIEKFRSICAVTAGGAAISRVEIVFCGWSVKAVSCNCELLCLWYFARRLSAFRVYICSFQLRCGLVVVFRGGTFRSGRGVT